MLILTFGSAHRGGSRLFLHVLVGRRRDVARLPVAIQLAKQPAFGRNILLCLVLENEVGRVWRDDAEFARHPRDLVADFGVFATQTNLVEEEGDPARGPKPRDKLACGTGCRPEGSSFTRVVKAALLAVAFADQFHLSLAGAAITPSHRDLVALEEIRKIARRPLGEARAFTAAELNAQVGQRRLGHLGEEVRELDLEILVGENVGAEGARLRRELIEQVSVHVGAHPEREDAHAAGRADAFLHHVENLLVARRPDVGETIGEEDHDVRPIGRGRTRSQRRLERLVNGGAAHRAELRNEVVRALPIGWCRLGELAEERFGRGREADDFETVLRIELADAERERLLGLVDLHALHGAGGVEHEGDVLGGEFALGRFHFRRGGGQEKKITVLVGRRVRLAIGQEIDGHFVGDLGLARANELEVTVGLLVLRLVGDGGAAAGVVALDGDLVAGRIERGERLVRIHLDLDRDDLDGLGGEFLRRERVLVSERA